MDKIIKAYTKGCTDCGKVSKLWTKLREFARRHDLQLMIIKTPLDPSTYAEANAYGVPQPFYVLNGVAHPLSDVLSIVSIANSKHRVRKNVVLKPESGKTPEVKGEETEAK